MNRYLKWGVAILAAILVFHFVPRSTPKAQKLPERNPLALADVRYWAYQTQDIALEGTVTALVKSAYDMIVMDPGRTDWSEETTQNFDTAAMVTRLKASPAHDGIHRKLVIAHLDIAEAESWRWYWTWSQDWEKGKPRPADWPGYIIEPDPESEGNDYPVAFWDSAWKDIVIYGSATPLRADEPQRDYVSLIDEALQDGFDGICLDWTEAYEDERIAAAAQRAGLDPAAEMVKFISEMRQYARKRNPNFLILQNGGSDLIADQPDIVNQVDGISQEAIWYTGDFAADWSNPDGYDRPADPLETEDLLENLKRYRDTGKPVFDLEYAVKQAAPAYNLSQRNGLIPYCTRTAANRLSDTPPPGM